MVLRMGPGDAAVGPGGWSEQDGSGGPGTGGSAGGARSPRLRPSVR